MSNKVALITGGARRLGAIITSTLHEASYNVIIHYRRSQNEAEKLMKELNDKRPNSAIIAPANLNEIETLESLIENPWGRLDLLVNNASSFYPTKFEESNEAQWDDLINSNLKGAYFLSAKVANALRKSQGHIINIIDVYGQKPLKNYPIYSIAKAGLQMMTKSLALELGPEVRVNGISPGSTIWPEGINQINEEKQKKLLRKTILNRKADPGDIAKAVLFFADSSSITGQILAVDSGRLVK